MSEKYTRPSGPYAGPSVKLPSPQTFSTRAPSGTTGGSAAVLSMTKISANNDAQSSERMDDLPDYRRTMFRITGRPADVRRAANRHTSFHPARYSRRMNASASGQLVALSDFVSHWSFLPAR